MTVDKFLQIGSDMLSLEMGEVVSQEISWLAAAVHARKISSTADPKTKAKLFSVNFRVEDQKNKPLLAQIRIYPQSDKPSKLELDLDWTTKLYLSQNFWFQKIVTNKEGQGCLHLPQGHYLVEISYGSKCSVDLFALDLCCTRPKTTQTVSTLISGKAVELVWEGDSVAIYSILHLWEIPQFDTYFGGDLHHHSIYSGPLHGGTDDVKDTPLEVKYSMQGQGLSFGVLSDHHNIFNHPQWNQLNEPDFLCLLGKEISTSNGHVLALACDQDIRYRIPALDIPSRSLLLQEEFLRICKEINQNQGLAQINHPRDYQAALAFPLEFLDQIGHFDLMEIWNGSNPLIGNTPNQRAFTLWLDLLEQDIFIPATAGSDTHNIDAAIYRQIGNSCYELCKEEKSQASQDKTSQQSSWGELWLPRLWALEAWSKLNLGSGGVRTYVQVETTLTKDSILAGLKKGKSFITNGPMIIPQIKYEEDFEQYKKIQLALIIRSNRPLTQLEIFCKHKKQTLLLDCVPPDQQGCYRYDNPALEIKLDFVAWNKNWLVFKVFSDFTHMAITNPLFFEWTND